MPNRTDIVVETDNAEGQVLLSASRVYDLTEDKTQDTINSEVRNTLNQLDAEKADEASLALRRSGATNTRAQIETGTYFYLDGTLKRAIATIAQNASFTAQNAETVTAGGLNAIGASVPNSDLDVGIYVITFQELSIGNFIFDKTVYISPGALREASIILHNANGTYWLSFEIYLSGGVLSAYGARYSTVSDTSIGNPATVNVVAVRKIK